MNHGTVKKIIGLFTLVVWTSQVSLFGQSGEEKFKSTCGACHSIGKGKLVGPDLKDVHKKRKEEWIIKFVKGSQAMVNSGDADAKAIFEEFNKMVMPDQALSDEEIKSVIAYIAEQSGGAAAPVAEAAPEKPAEPAAAAPPDLIAAGKAYYEGSKRFSNGGPSCISCHNVNYPGMIAGGVLAKDLTNSYARLGGDAGISGMLTSPPFPAMTSAFKDNPITPEEIKALAAFLKDADKPSTTPGNNPLLLGGFIGFIVLFILIFLIWNKRKNNSVKSEYHDRQIQASN